MRELLINSLSILSFITQVAIWFVVVKLIIGILKYYIEKMEESNMRKKRSFGFGQKEEIDIEQMHAAVDTATTGMQKIMDLCLSFEKTHGSRVKDWDIITILQFTARLNAIGEETSNSSSKR